jgi:hypothetical protein
MHFASEPISRYKRWKILKLGFYISAEIEYPDDDVDRRDILRVTW